MNRLLRKLYIRLLFHSVNRLEQMGVYYYVYIDPETDADESFNLYWVFNRKTRGGEFHA